MLVPPFGQERIPLMKSIFDVQHIKENAYFLNTQCKNLSSVFLNIQITFSQDRMPIFIGNFISQKVYDGILQSRHRIQDASCVALIDVYKGSETKSGFSYTVWSRLLEEGHYSR